MDAYEAYKVRCEYLNIRPYSLTRWKANGCLPADAQAEVEQFVREREAEDEFWSEMENCQ